MKRGHGRRTWAPLAAMVPLAMALAVTGPITTIASPSPGYVSVGPAALAGNSHVAAGDTLSVGYDLSLVSPPSSPVEVDLVDVRVSLSVSCTPNASPTRTSFSLPDATYSVGSGWQATSSAQAAQGYQGSTTIPSDQCHGNRLWVQDVSLSGTLRSAGGGDQVQVRIHAIDAGTDCSTQGPPPGSSTCNAPWSSPGTADTAAVPQQQTAGSGSTGGAPTGSTGNTGNTPGSGGSSSPGGASSGSSSGSGTSSGGNGSTSSGSGTSSGGPGSTSSGSGSVSTAAATTSTGSHVVASGKPATAGALSGSSRTAAGAVQGLTTGPSTALDVSTNRSLPVVVGSPPVLGAPARAAAAGLSRVTGGADSSVLGQLPVRWYMVLLAFDGLLVIGIVVRRRRARQEMTQ